MKNETMFKKQNVMRRNIMIYLMIFAGGSLIFKALNHVSINLKTSTMEIYILILSMMLFTIQASRLIGVPVKDEKIVKERYLINRIGFHTILWGGMLMHFVSNLIYNIWVDMSSNTFISIVILGGFIVAVLSAKKQGYYINQKSIELDMKNYYLQIGKNIGKLWLIAIGYATIIYSLSLTLQIPITIVTVVWSYILLSIILFSIIYILFAIYEKIDYDEKLLLTLNQQRPYLSKKVILLGLPIIGYSIMTSGLNLLYWQSRMNGNIAMERVFHSVNELLRIWLIDFAFVALLLSYVIYKSLKSLPTDKPKLFKYYPIIIWAQFVFSLSVSFVMIFMSLYPGELSMLMLGIITKTISYISLGLAFVTLIIHIYIYPYLKNNHFPATKIFLVIPIFPILMYAIEQFQNQLSQYVNNVLYQVNLASFILTLITSLLYYFMYCRMSNDLYHVNEIVIKEEDSKIVLNKELI